MRSARSTPSAADSCPGIPITTTGRGDSIRRSRDVLCHGRFRRDWLDLAEYVTGRQITEVDARFSTLRPTRYREGEPVHVDAEDYVRLFLELSGGVVGSATFSGVTAGEPNGCFISVEGTEGGFGWKVDRPNDRTRMAGTVATISRNPDAMAPDAARLSFARRPRRRFRRRVPESVPRRLLGDRRRRRLLSNACRRLSHGCAGRGHPGERACAEGGEHC